MSPASMRTTRTSARSTDALTLDATLRCRSARGLSVEARGENIGDRRVETAVSHRRVERAAPRTLWLGLRFAG